MTIAPATRSSPRASSTGTAGSRCEAEAGAGGRHDPPCRREAPRGLRRGSLTGSRRPTCPGRTPDPGRAIDGVEHAASTCSWVSPAGSPCTRTSGWTVRGGSSAGRAPRSAAAAGPAPDRSADRDRESRRACASGTKTVELLGEPCSRAPPGARLARTRPVPDPEPDLDVCSPAAPRLRTRRADRGRAARPTARLRDRQRLPLRGALGRGERAEDAAARASTTRRSRRCTRPRTASCARTSGAAPRRTVRTGYRGLRARRAALPALRRHDHVGRLGEQARTAWWCPDCQTCETPSPDLAARRHPWAIATPHTAATDAGARAFERGGNAIDAALAAAVTLAVIYPHKLRRRRRPLRARAAGRGRADDPPSNSSGRAPPRCRPRRAPRRARRHDAAAGPDPDHGPRARSPDGRRSTAGGADCRGRRLRDRHVASRTTGSPPRTDESRIRCTPRQSRVAADPGLRDVFFPDGAPLARDASCASRRSARRSSAIAVGRRRRAVPRGRRDGDTSPACAPPAPRSTVEDLAAHAAQLLPPLSGCVPRSATCRWCRRTPRGSPSCRCSPLDRATRARPRSAPAPTSRDLARVFLSANAP